MKTQLTRWAAIIGVLAAFTSGGFYMGKGAKTKPMTIQEVAKGMPPLTQANLKVVDAARLVGADGELAQLMWAWALQKQAELNKAEAGATNQLPVETYTVKAGPFETTNAVEIIPNHEHRDPPCTLIRYIENGHKVDFHAWAVPVTVTTNKSRISP